ncbi:LacI family DNA-binding transcriptional regulator [Amnibacterium sp. CER49]|uniref:LacI family DNA-binding transcriptional regulator n=1 Tax=Amnibacterium sp. CER49 TaxID=3039161 RepID=UPI00244C96F5|nr:LacI family DNA-binding transcriptional regulator [Amnibacterium sp. CER49]MDH2443804.1 LacI family DNA-binding transcriptional regulator [Amnibacterium sp. CER49]
MQEVADRANVSISTVSFVVNGTKPVAPETRRKILQAIDDLGYRRNAMARALASRRSHILCLLLPILDHDLSSFIAAAADAARDAGYDLMLWPMRNSEGAHEVASVIEAGIADGILLLEVQQDDERVTNLRSDQAPFALIGRTRDVSGVDYVDMDFEQTTRDVVDELADLGHRHLTLLLEDFAGTPLAGYSPPVRVEQTFREAIARRGLIGAVLRSPIGPDQEDLLRRMAEEAPDTTAVIGMHATALARLVGWAQRRGVRIPEDLSVVGISTTGAVALLEPPITRWDGPGAEMGRRATEALIRRLRDPECAPTQLLIPCLRREGASVAPPSPGRRALAPSS